MALDKLTKSEFGRATKCGTSTHVFVEPQPKFVVDFEIKCGIQVRGHIYSFPSFENGTLLHAG